MSQPTIDLGRVIVDLLNPAAYPHPVEDVLVRQTHISVVFLAGPHAYKVKKPVDLGFLDFSSLAKRQHYCEEEVRLNRRLAGAVYQGVVPVTMNGDCLRIDGSGEVVEWAVRMERLPEEATLRDRLRRGTVSLAQVEALARTIADFHARAVADRRTMAFGRFDVVAGNARENFAQAAPQVGVTLSPAVAARLQQLTETELLRCRPLIDSRAERGVPRDTHGDLHLDHVYLLPDRSPPHDLVVVDCIEFNERFRFADPVADMAFLVMDFRFDGRRDFARAFAEAYFQAAGDDEGRALLPFYTAYRAVVRAKVEGFELAEPEIPAAERHAALRRARAHWLLALGELEEASRRPCLVLVGGLPGTGKSSLARALAAAAGFQVIRSDVVRKELAGLAAPVKSAASFEQGIYSPIWTERTYAECLRRAEALLFEGQRVLVDATFAQEEPRRTFLERAECWGVPGLFLLCRAEPEVVRRRLRERRGDASDADWTIYQATAARWDEPESATPQTFRPIATAGSLDVSLEQALIALRDLGLQDLVLSGTKESKDRAGGGYSE
jgi:aminoglycoside phosphotransferase family enzyme/predicted kinase